MMAKKSKGVAAATAMLLLGMAAMGCSGGKGNGNEASSPVASTPPPASSQAAEQPANEEPITIKWLSEDPPTNDNTIVQQYLEKKFNIKIENVRFDNSTFQDQFNIAITTGDIPDLAWGRYNYETAAAQGVFAELSVDEMKKYMPKYSAMIEAASPALWKSYEVNGKNYGIPKFSPNANSSPVPTYRADYMRKTGITEAPKTLAEMEETFRKFRNDDPDGNGKKDTFGISGRGDALWIDFWNVFGAYDVQMYRWAEGDDGKLVYGNITDNAREAFRTLQRWYKEGLIDPEFYSNTAQQYLDKIYNGTVGYAEINSSVAGAPSVLVKDAEPMKAFHPDAELTVGYVVSGPDGQPGLGLSGGVKAPPISFGAQVAQDEKKRIKLYEIIEAMTTDEEVYLMTYFGEAGVHYNLVDGAVEKLGDWADNNKRAAELGASNYYNLFANGGGSASPAMTKFHESKEIRDFKQAYFKDMKVRWNAVDFAIPGAEQYPDLKKIEDEHFIKFIVGDANLDADFDAYVKLWLESGGQAVTDSANEVYAARKS